MVVGFVSYQGYHNGRFFPVAQQVDAQGQATYHVNGICLSYLPTTSPRRGTRFVTVQGHEADAVGL